MIVQDNVVIGANATIVAGVILNAVCIIGAGSVVTNIPQNEVWAGNPARFLMTVGRIYSRRESSE